MTTVNHSEPTILAIETSTNLCSVALSYQGETFERSELGINVHSKVLLEMSDELLNQAGIQVDNLDALAVSKGPGSFTGLRIGIGVAQGLAYGSQKQMIGIDSLAALVAASKFESETIIAGIDARMGELYWCEYLLEAGGVLSKGEIQVSNAQEVLLVADNQVHLIGNAWQEHFDLLPESLKQRAVIDKAVIYPQAKEMLDLAKKAFQNRQLQDPSQFAPLYIRNNVAKKPKQN